MRFSLLLTSLIAVASSAYAADGTKREPAMGAVLPPPTKEAAAVLRRDADRLDAARDAMNGKPTKPAKPAAERPTKPPKPATERPPKPAAGKPGKGAAGSSK